MHDLINSSNHVVFLQLQYDERAVAAGTIVHPYP